MFGRAGIVRAYWEVPGDWQSRAIQARLRLRAPDGDVISHDVEVSVSGESAASDLGRTFTWELGPNDVIGGLDYVIELREVGEPDDDLTPSTEVPMAPVSGYAELGTTDDAMRLKVVFVPVEYDDGMGCATDTREMLEDDAILQPYLDRFLQNNPIQEFEYSIRDAAMIWDGPVSDLNLVNAELMKLRMADDPPANAYYYAFLNVDCSGYDGPGGMAEAVVPPTVDAANIRVACGRYAPDERPLEWNLNMPVHEIGHLQGLDHAPCGGAGGADPDYPYPDASIGVWGYGILDGELRDPEAYQDYMSYCEDYWISDFTWRNNTAYARELTSWDDKSLPLRPTRDRQILVGVLSPGGEEHWFAIDGHLPPSQTSREALVVRTGGRTVRAPIIEGRGHGHGSGSRMVYAPLPVRASEILEVRWADDPARRPIVLARP